MKRVNQLPLWISCLSPNSRRKWRLKYKYLGKILSTARRCSVWVKEMLWLLWSGRLGSGKETAKLCGLNYDRSLHPHYNISQSKIVVLHAIINFIVRGEGGICNTSIIQPMQFTNKNNGLAGELAMKVRIQIRWKLSMGVGPGKGIEKWHHLLPAPAIFLGLMMTYMCG